MQIQGLDIDDNEIQLPVASSAMAWEASGTIRTRQPSASRMFFQSTLTNKIVVNNENSNVVHGSDPGPKLKYNRTR